MRQQMALQARPSRTGGPSRDLKFEMQDLAFRMARANYSSELIYAALNGLRAGWCAHLPESRNPQPAAAEPKPSTPASMPLVRRPRKGGRPSKERRAARRFDARAKQQAAEKEAARKKVVAEKEAVAQKAQVAAEKEAARKKIVAAEKEAARKKIVAAEKEAKRVAIARIAEIRKRLNSFCTPQQRKSLRAEMLALQESESDSADSSDDEPPPPRRRK